MKIAVALCALALMAASSSSVAAAPTRDEAKASRYLYCAGLSAYWVQALQDKQPGSSEIVARQTSSDEFWEATVLFSDSQFALAHKGEVVQKVRSVVASADQDKGVHLTSEDLSCNRALHDEVIPLLKAQNLIPGEAFDTTVPVLHVADVTRDIVEWHAKRHPDCKFQKVVGAKVIQRGAKAVTEHWTILACDGKKFTYQVGILPAEGGLSDFVGDVETPANESPKPLPDSKQH